MYEDHKKELGYVKFIINKGYQSNFDTKSNKTKVLCSKCCKECDRFNRIK
jgi:hypothetical protein